MICLLFHGINTMCADKIIRRFAGVFVMLSVALGVWVSPWFFAFTAFVGFNLVQSSYTNFCPLEKVLTRVGFPGCATQKR